MDKINEYITSKSVVYDGKRVKWCGNYETLQEFVRTAFRQQGKWWLPGGNARRFDAFTSDFVVIWYPGKLSTLTFKGESGLLAKEYLIDPNISPQSVCEDDPVKPCEISHDDDDEGMGNVMFEIEVIKSGLDAMKSLLDSRGEPSLCQVKQRSEVIAN